MILIFHLNILLIKKITKLNNKNENYDISMYKKLNNNYKYKTMKDI